MMRVSRPRQSTKASVPMDWSPSGRVMEVRRFLSEKARGPMEITLGGTTNEESESDGKRTRLVPSLEYKTPSTELYSEVSEVTE